MAQPISRNVSYELHPDGPHEQSALEYLNINIHGDNLRFLDPGQISRSNHPIAEAVRIKCQSFLDSLLQALRPGRPNKASHFLAHIGERPEFNLGLCKAGTRGRGTGDGGRASIVNAFSKSRAIQSGLVSDLLDVALLVDRIGQDKVSDLIANIAWDEFAQYTEALVDEHQPRTTKAVGYSWNPDSSSWTSSHRRAILVDNMSGAYVILVPHRFTRERKAYIPFARYLLDHDHPLTDLLVSLGSDIPIGASRLTKSESLRYLNQSHEGKGLSVSLAEKFPEVYKKYKTTV